MGRRKVPSQKHFDMVIDHLRKGAVTSTGGFGRLAGKIASILNIQHSYVVEILYTDPRIYVQKVGDNDVYIAKLKK